MIPVEEVEKVDSPHRKAFLRWIASKLILKDKKLLTKINVLVDENSTAFETMKTRMEYKENPSLLDEFPLWQGRGESNPR